MVQFFIPAGYQKALTLTLPIWMKCGRIHSNWKVGRPIPDMIMNYLREEATQSRKNLLCVPIRKLPLRDIFIPVTHAYSMARAAIGKRENIPALKSQKHVMEFRRGAARAIAH